MKYIIWKDKKIEVKPEFLRNCKTWFERTNGLGGQYLFPEKYPEFINKNKNI